MTTDPRPEDATIALFGDDPEIIKQLREDLASIDVAQRQNIDPTELQISRLGLAQGLTPEVAKKETGWTSGVLYDTVLREIISYPAKQPWLQDKGVPPGDCKTVECLMFVPIFKLPTEYAEWPTKEQRAAGEKMYHWKTLDVTEERVRAGIWKPKGFWTGEGSPPVTEHINILGVGLTLDGKQNSNLLVSSWSRTNNKTGKKFVTSCESHRLDNMPYWGRVYYLYSQTDQNAAGQIFSILEFAKGKKIQDACKDIEDARKIYKTCLEISKQLRDSKELQEMYLNLAQFDAADDVSPEFTGSTEGGTEDPNF